jgi:CheY-like chemotaxis protein
MGNTSFPFALRILIVDDNPDTTGTLALLLETWGHAVWVAQDGPTGLEKAQSCRPNVVISDIGLPGLNGWEFAQRVRALGLDKTLLLAVSGYAHEEDARRSQEAGFNHHLIKPVDPGYLNQILLARSTELASARTGALVGDRVEPEPTL